MVKGIAILLLVVFAGGYLAGAFGPQAYSRTVSRSPAEVMAALETMDITAQPGAPGSTAAAAGGIKPLFRLAKANDRLTWYVMSGDKVATTMTASLEPIDGGKGTTIRTAVERGNAPDDLVSPAFRSKGLTMALFGMAIEGRMNKLAAPPAAAPEDCQKLIDHMADDNRMALGGSRPANLTQSVAGGAQTIMRLNAMEQELRRNGCDTNDDGSFHHVDERMAPANPVSILSSDPADRRRAGPFSSSTTAADRPMLDPTPNR
jgi:hypothetical protein